MKCYVGGRRRNHDDRKGAITGMNEEKKE